MKTALLFISVLFCINLSIKAQSVNGILIKDFNVEYVQITERELLFRGAKINLLINYGQPIKLDGNAEKLLLDSTGKKMEFNSLIDALNFMSENGYELAHPYGPVKDTFLMRRKKLDPTKEIEMIQ